MKLRSMHTRIRHLPLGDLRSVSNKSVSADHARVNHTTSYGGQRDSVTLVGALYSLHGHRLTSHETNEAWFRKLTLGMVCRENLQRAILIPMKHLAVSFAFFLLTIVNVVRGWAKSNRGELAGILD